MEIKNECKQKEEKKKFVQRSLADIQRNKLNKLMENPVINSISQLIPLYITYSVFRTNQ